MRGYSAPCMLQESPSLPIVLMCLVERRSPRMEERWGERKALDRICARGVWERGRWTTGGEGGRIGFVAG